MKESYTHPKKNINKGTRL